MKKLHSYIRVAVLCLTLLTMMAAPLLAREGKYNTLPPTLNEITPKEEAENTVDVKDIVFSHIGDAYEWHITTWGKTHVTIPLPVIVYFGMALLPLFPLGRERGQLRGFVCCSEGKQV